MPAIQSRMKSKTAHHEQLARSAGDIQEYNEVQHVWLDQTPSTSQGTHALES
jgi:hypothetical protein